MKKHWVLALCMAAVSPTLSQAAESDDAIAFRQGIFHALEWNFKEMGAMAQGRTPFDAERFTLQAKRIAELAQMAGEGFIKGSETGDEVTSRASEKIWYQREHFDRLMQQLVDRSAELEALTRQTQERASLRPALARVAETCKSCHDDYRLRF